MNRPPHSLADSERVLGAHVDDALRNAPVIWITGQHPLACNAIANRLNGLLTRREYDTVILHEARLAGGLCEPAFTRDQMRENERRLAFTADLFQRAGHIVIVCTGFRPSGWTTVARWILEETLFEVTLATGEPGRASSQDCALTPLPRLSLNLDGHALDAGSTAALIAAKAGFAQGL